MNDVVMSARKNKLTKSQYVMFLLADVMTWCETAATLCCKAADYNGKIRSPEFMNAAARLFVRETCEKVYLNCLKIAKGCDSVLDDITEKLSSLNLAALMQDNLKDMDIISAELVK